ncbi:MAG: thiol peroxidase [Pirellulaceae bacterium]
MAVTKLKGNPVNTCGDLPTVGSSAPEFRLVGTDLAECGLGDFKGKNVVLSVFPSVDTPTCATSVRKFNAQAAALNNTVVINVSRDLPFAQKRFCAAEGIENVKSLSGFRCDEFGKKYGVALTEGPLKGLYARAVIVINGDGKVVHQELVPEIADEPNYAAALAAIK